MTGADACKLIADVTGEPVTRVINYARVLREADIEYWPQAGFGGGSAAVHIEASHLASLVIALAASPEVKAAPQTLGTFSHLVRIGGPFASDAATRFPATFAASLLLDFDEALAMLIEGLPGNREYDAISLEIGTDPMSRPAADLSLWQGDERHRLAFYMAPRERMVKARSPLSRMSILSPPLFQVCAEIAPDRSNRDGRKARRCKPAATDAADGAECVS